MPPALRSGVRLPFALTSSPRWGGASAVAPGQLPQPQLLLGEARALSNATRIMSCMDFDFEGTFDEDYVYFYSAHHTPEVNQQQAQKIVALLNLKPDHKILDVPCGYGRI